MNRRFLITAGLLVFAIGGAGVIGLLYALMRGEEYHPLAVLAAVFGHMLLPLIDRRLRRKEQSGTKQADV